MSNIIIVGGGASGLIASIYAKRNGNKVTILEKNTNCGKKILITGNGKCNYWNEFQSLNHYHSNNIEIYKNILTKENLEESLHLFKSIGIIPKIKDGYYYPYSNQATSIQTALIKEAELSGVKIINNIEVLNITKENKHFIIKTNLNNYTCDKIILATGSKSYPKTGSDGSGYTLAESLGHSIIKPLPALTGLRSNVSYLKEWHGIRSDVSVSLIENKHVINTQIGEIQLTNYGLSGICIFNLSSQVSRGLNENKKEQVSINFLYPFNIYNQEEFIKWMDNRNSSIKNRTISDLLDGLLNYKLINLILKLSKINRNSTWDTISIKEKYLLCQNLINHTLDIIETNNFDNAQVTTGGIPLIEINPYTMESLKTKNLYITGELLDVDGECGGYNLTNAWITGLIAGKGVNND